MWFITRKLIMCSTIIPILAGCSGEDCGFVLDQIRYADKIHIEDKTYYLYTRTTGWHDKVVFFELYDAEPDFDYCRKTKAKLIYIIDYNDYPVEQYVKALTFHPDHKEKLKITYTTDASEGVKNVYDVKFTQK